MNKNTSILVTGGTGFLGHNVAKQLRQRGYKRVEAIGSADCDLTDPFQSRLFWASRRPQIVIHCAGEVGGILANQRNGASFMLNNLKMGMNAIEFSALNGCEKFILISTVCSYPKFTEVPFTEDQIYNGYPEETNAPYGLAKRTLMTLLETYKKAGLLNGITLLPTNLYGPGDNFNEFNSHVIPAIIRKLYFAKKDKLPSVKMWGTGTVTREFLYIEDCAEGVILAMENYDGPPVNLGTGKETIIKGLADKLAELMDYHGAIEWNPEHPDGQPRRVLDITNSACFGFCAKTSLSVGLKKTIEWFHGKTNSI